jgi:hypothetical protein
LFKILYNQHYTVFFYDIHNGGNNMMSGSPDRGTFRANAAKQRAEEAEISADNAEATAEIYRTANQLRREREQDPEWQKNNMEYDMRTADWMVAKVRESEAYAQNLYAAMCNQDFQKNDVWPVLKNETWSASWRYAGGIVADMRGRGDYMDWYCSGIRGGISESELAEMTAEQHQQYHWYEKNFVSETVVTDEIRADLQKLGWNVIHDQEDI